MKIKMMQRRAFVGAYDQAMINIMADLKDYGRYMLQTLDQRDFDREWNDTFFMDMARQALLEQLPKLYEHYAPMEAAVRLVHGIIDEDTENDKGRNGGL